MTKAFLRKSLFALGIVAVFGGGVIAGTSALRVQAADIYAKRANGTGNCVQWTAASNQLTVKIQTGLGTIQASTRSDNNTRYLLYEDAACSTPIQFTGQ